MKRYGGWLVLVALLTLGGTYEGVRFFGSLKVGGGYEGGSGLSVQDDGALLSTATLTGTQLVSTVATGTAPLVVASTTLVPNLHAATADLVTRATTADSATTAFDISDDTNLSAGSGIVLTGDALSHDTAAGYKHIPSGGTIYNILTSTGASGTGAWSDEVQVSNAYIGGGYGNTGATINSSGTITADGVITGYGGLVARGASPSLAIYAASPSENVWSLNAGGIDGVYTCDVPSESGTLAVLPSYGTAGQVLQSDADGTLSWRTVVEGGTVNIEALPTAGALGTAPVSDGDGTLTMTSVAAASHAHTGSTLSGIDMSDDTNWAAGLGLSISGDTVALDESAALSGDHTMDANTLKFGVNGIIFEGATANTFEGYDTVTALSADQTWTRPNLSGTYALTGAAQNVSFGTLDTSGAVSFQNRYYNQGLYNAVYSNQVDVATEGNVSHKVLSTTGGISYSFEPTTASNGNAFYRLFRYASLNGTGKAYFYIYEPNTSTARFTVDAATGDTTSTGTVSAARVNTTGGVHVGGTPDPGTDNLIVDGTSTLTGNVDTAGVLQAGSGNINLTNSTGNILWAAMETPTIKETIILTAAGGEPTTTAGCAASAKKETTTNKRNYRSLDFDPGTDESAFWNVTTLPDDYAGGTFIVNIKWKAAGTGDVCWSIASVASGNDDVYDAAVGTAVTVTDSVTTAGDEEEATTSAMTAAGTPVAGDSLYVVITRDANNAADTVAGDVELLGASLDYVSKVN